MLSPEADYSGPCVSREEHPQWEAGAGSLGRVYCSKTFCKHPKPRYYIPGLHVIHVREKRHVGEVFSCNRQVLVCSTFGKNGYTLTFNDTGKDLEGLK